MTGESDRERDIRAIPADAAAQGAIPSAGSGELTIAIPFYRQTGYLREAIASVQRQTVSDWRLIISGDGPGQTEVAEFVAGLQDDRIRYEPSGEPLGMVGNWNRCLELAETELVTLLHEDDLLEPDYVAGMRAAAAADPAATAFFCQTKIVNGRGEPTFSFPDLYKSWIRPGGRAPFSVAGEAGLCSLLRGNYIFCPTLCYRKSRLGRLRFDARWQMVQDLDLIVRLLLAGATLTGLPGVWYRYRRHAENATVTYTRNLQRFREEWSFSQELARELTERKFLRAARLARNGQIIKMNLAYCAVRSSLGFRWSAAARQGKLLATLLCGGDPESGSSVPEASRQQLENSAPAPQNSPIKPD